MFLDHAIVDFVSGTGGSGAVAFHREKHVPRGGPNGADGGKGGDIVLIADRGKRTLYDFKLKSKFEAENGSHAIGNKRGKNGRSIEIKVPVGTVLIDDVLGDVLIDLNLDGMKYVVCQGGRGGFGNMHYVSSVRQAPNFAQKGAPGDLVRARLELKLLADVGLIGLPNAGKSTLISQISAARPKIGDYPFTTIIPNLGVVSVADETFVAADMPGLIEGAHTGHGLGHQFLKHVERTKVLVHVVDVFPIDESNPLSNYELVERELALYSSEIASKPRLIALNKIDLLGDADLKSRVTQFEGLGPRMFPISAVTGLGIEPLKFAMKAELDAVEAATPAPVLMPAKKVVADDSWDVKAVDGGWEITGRRMLRMVAMTNLENADALRYLHRRLVRLGVIEMLREMGAQEGDNVYVGSTVFSFTDEL